MRKTLAIGVLALAAAAGPAATASAKDVNHDRIPDRWERAYHLSLRVDQSNRDQDHDGLKNLAEFRDHTSPRTGDTNGNGVPDAHEDANHDGVANGDQQPGSSHSEPQHGDTTPPQTGGNEPGHEQAPAGAAGYVLSYTQSPGFGGVLVIQRSNGEKVSAYFGEKTDLECAAADASFSPCTKDHLATGTLVAGAEHGVNAYGADVWTKVLLLHGGASQQPPPEPPHSTPPPAPQPAVGGTIVSYEQSPYFGGTLTIERPSGERVSAWYGDATDLRCAPAAGGDYAACTKAQLQAGVVATDARHAVNAGGHDAWTRLYLVVPGFSG